MSLGTAMQRSMTASTSYQSSAPTIRAMPRVGRAKQSSGRAGNLASQCSAYRQNCGFRYGPQRGFNGGFGPISFGEGAMAAAQIAELMQNFAKSVNQSTNNSTEAPTPAGFLPVDLEEHETKYLLIADIPGLEKSDLKISINQTEQTLKVSGDRKRAQYSENTDDSSKQKFRRQYERGMGKFQRTISGLPKDADLSQVSAKVDKGVLTITVQKREPVREEQDIRIDID